MNTLDPKPEYISVKYERLHEMLMSLLPHVPAYPCTDITYSVLRFVDATDMLTETLGADDLRARDLWAPLRVLHPAVWRAIIRREISYHRGGKGPCSKTLNNMLRVRNWLAIQNKRNLLTYATYYA